ncbi:MULTISPECIES: alpha-amylase [unclassified Streptomyces]|uniref:alpha-amylase n=1 Tax=unclassified Streptomyces TaxID=2593676 RepID=UPI00339F1125
MVALCALGPVPAAAAADSFAPAPACLELAGGWRYTLVSNHCGTPHRVTVEYRDGTVAPCREAAAGDTVTFAGYGPQGNEALGVRLCAAAEEGAGAPATA